MDFHFLVVDERLNSGDIYYGNQGLPANCETDVSTFGTCHACSRLAEWAQVQARDFRS
jgi:hypothetical protein